MRLNDYQLNTYIYFNEEFFSVDEGIYWRTVRVWGDSKYQTDGNGYEAKTDSQHHLIFNYDFNRTTRKT